MREVCSHNSFVIQTIDDNDESSENISRCFFCWCYVCDCEARSCHQWDSHCHSHHNSPHWQQKRRLANLSTKFEKGPFAPNHTDAPHDETLTQCRHCQWYFRFPEKLIEYGKSQEVERPLPCQDDWCGWCGRVALDKDLQKNQQAATSPLTSSSGGDYFLYGIKEEIPFTVVAHDPRLVKKYKQAWSFLPINGPSEHNPDDYERRWTYDEGNRQNEVFLHRLGGSPKLASLMKIVAVGPVSGKDKNDDAILLKENHYLLFNFLMSSGNGKIGKVDIKASWSKSNKSGVSVFAWK